MPYTVKWIVTPNESLSEQELHRIKNKEIEERISVFEKYRNINPSIVTAWWADTDFNPSVLSMIDDRYHLCSIRQNKTEQLLSGLLTIYNCNYNGEVEGIIMFDIKEELSSLYDILTSRVFDMEILCLYSILHNLNITVISNDYLISNKSENESLSCLSRDDIMNSDLIIIYRESDNTIKILKNRFF